MHEMALVRELVAQVNEAVGQSGAERVTSVNLVVGQGRDIVPELFFGIFEMLAEGTALEGAELAIDSRPYLARCKQCGRVRPINPFDRSTRRCPVCESGDYVVVSGMEFAIESIEVA